MGNEWAAERVVDVALASQLIGRRFPDLRDAPVRVLATGWDNTVFLVGEEWVFRFPRRAVALDGVRREIAVLPRLARRLPLPIPDPELVGEPVDEYDWPWWGARPVPGVELCDSRLADDARGELAGDVGRFLRVLHDVEVTPELAAELPIDPLRRADVAYRGPWARQRLETLQRLGIRDSDPRADRLLDEAALLPPSSARPVLLHGDLHVRHLLAEGGRASGFIDWGDVCVGDPSIDLSLAFSAFDAAARETLLMAYGPIDDETACRARVLAVFLCAALAEYAADESRPALLAESIAGLDRAVG